MPSAATSTVKPSRSGRVGRRRELRVVVDQQQLHQRPPHRTVSPAPECALNGPLAAVRRNSVPPETVAAMTTHRALPCLSCASGLALLGSGCGNPAAEPSAPPSPEAVIDPGDGGQYAPAIEAANFVDTVDNPTFRWQGDRDGSTTVRLRARRSGSRSS